MLGEPDSGNLRIPLRVGLYHLCFRAQGSLLFPFVFLLDFLLVVPDVERHIGKKIKKIWVTRVANLISEIVIGTPNVI
jgi:hypothetical protein